MGNVPALIHKLLVANRGEIASRVFRTAHAKGISTVAVFSEADAALPFVAQADEAVCIGPGPVGESYLDPERILDAARRTGADAIHPGYGFLSENAAFAEAVVQAGLTWVGPTAASIVVMGDKSKARQLAHELGVPTVPGYDGDDQSDAVMTREAERIGYPVLVKAAGGGGGRGMRRVHQPGELTAALASARREAQAGFDNPKLLLEKLVLQPRHIEVQVFGDGQGHVVHLFERECSVQRRHQKIVEEAPSPAVDDALRARLGAAACTVAAKVDYAGAGTVEFLLDADGRFYFLEMNTRLQVEHPATELITKQDLVAAQLAVAEGRGLPWTQDELGIHGHAIEVRVYAEDPMRDWLPAVGTPHRIDFPADDGVRVDAGYASGNGVSPHYDSMLAKIIAWGPDRATANRRLARAVGRAWVPGLVTNLPLLRDICANAAWQQGALHTGFLAEQGLPTAPPLNLDMGVLLAEAWFAQQQQQGAPWASVARAGWRVHGSAQETETWSCFGEERTVTAWSTADARVVRIGDAEHRVRALGTEGGVFHVEIDGIRRSARIAATEDAVYAHFGDGECFVQRAPRFPPPASAADEPGAATAPTPGTVVAVNVAVGDDVAAGQALVVLEAMKMEHTVSAAEAGTVAEVRVGVGDAVDEGALLVRIDKPASDE